MPTVRLNKALATAGIASRRAADELIRSGRVSVNGRRVTELGAKVDPQTAQIAVDGNRIDAKMARESVLLILNKPRGVICTLARHGDAHAPTGPTLVELLPSRFGRLFTVGRLDRESQGLLLITNDGDLAHRLTHPSFEVEREYLVTLDKPLTHEEIRRLDQGGVPLASTGERVGQSLVTFAGKSPNGHPRYRFVLREGKNREIRELAESLHREVKRLKRLRYGSIELGDVELGSWKQVPAADVRQLRSLVGMADEQRDARPVRARKARKQPDDNRRIPPAGESWT